MVSDFALLELQVEALFAHDDRGRIRRTNEPNGRIAPRLFLARSGDGNLWRFREDLPESVVARLTRILVAEPVDEGLRREPRCLDVVLGKLAELGAGCVGHHGPAFRFPDDLPGREDAVEVRAENVALLGPWFADLIPELDARRPCFAVVRDGAAVSVCFCARRSARAAEAGVETREDFRGHGYATAVTSAWAEAIRREGLHPLYSTSWENLASQRVARRLRLTMYGVDLSID